jgi:ubiquinone biosynthesis protein
LIERILVATDRSDTATRAVEWAAEMAERYTAELLVLQVVAPEHLIGSTPVAATMDAELAELARRLAGERGRSRLEYDSQPAEAIVQVAEEEGADIIVVGNVSMRDRTEFLLGSVPNRVSHTSPCTVAIVNTSGGDLNGGNLHGGSSRARQAETDGEVSDGQLLGRAARIAAVIAKYRLGNILDRSPEGESADVARAQRFRQALEELGPTFAKLGQILSTRPDLLPRVFVEELSTLQDQVTPLSEAEVVAVMESELRVPCQHRAAAPGGRDDRPGASRHPRGG